ncbi:MAG: helix-turn-helix domain-containing protein [Thermoanaerobaculia bacterium]
MRSLTGKLGQTIREAREARGFTQRQLARRCGMCLRRLISIEAGANFSVALLVAIDRALSGALPLGVLSNVGSAPGHRDLGTRTHEPGMSAERPRESASE